MVRKFTENGSRIVGVCPNCFKEITMEGTDQHHITYNIDSSNNETVVEITCHWDKRKKTSNEKLID